jgi:uncharacterized protein YqfB (UPF0267 family)
MHACKCNCIEKICVSVNDLHLHGLYTPHIQLYTLTRTTLVYTLTNIYPHTDTIFLKKMNLINAFSTRVLGLATLVIRVTQ